MTHLPNDIVNHIIGYARPKPKYVYHLTNICKIAELKSARGSGNCRVIDYLRNVYFHQKNNKLKTTNNYLVLNQLKHLIFTYNQFKEDQPEDFGLGLAEWFYWWNYEHTLYTSDDAYSSYSDYSSEDDDNNDY